MPLPVQEVPQRLLCQRAVWDDRGTAAWHQQCHVCIHISWPGNNFLSGNRTNWTHQREVEEENFAQQNGRSKIMGARIQWILKNPLVSHLKTNVSHTLLQKRKQVWFEFPAEIPMGHELMMQMLLKNAKIKIIWVGTLTLVYIYTKKLFSKIYNIFY